ncbi:PRC-barrel domain-containing protein [Jiangella sp. DSM 45060]|uniref:PRC-barrel domain-containing protein n=1 Tax=Jiangella sp. DSM 45060 TaxID=1798224 RepID=UPI0008794A28|nr:PRC-barrel domain-containing protein [Jiangella sp. DSM 45060]SDT60732.1 Sporulation protein YlmC, PRC-barrel domain family [Jiangella sp. DSM 45060]
MTTDTPHTLVHLTDSGLAVTADDDVRGREVVDRNGDEVGTVDDLVIDPEEKKVRFLQVGSGGFLGLGERKQLIPVDAIVRIDEKVHIAQDRGHVAGAPAYDPDLVPAREYYEELYGYYGYPPFWAAGYAYPPYPFYL